MALAWLSPDEWRSLLEQAGFEVEACYGWFDRSPLLGPGRHRLGREASLKLI